jgi:hypothetical protein
MFTNVPDDATGYVMAAYIFFLLMIVIYIGILGAKFQRINRDIGQLTDEIEAGKVEGRDGTRTEQVKEQSNV